MTRLIDPPISAFDCLTEGERQVINLFYRHLGPTWEMYVKPHLNGLRPNLVLLNPDVGIAVFEIRDWDLSERDGKSFLIKDNPIDKIRLYESEILELYCPRLDAKVGKAVITAGLVFTKTPRQRVVALLDPFRDEAMRKYPEYYPIAGSDDLLKLSSLDHVFPEWARATSNYMRSDMAKDLRSWLREPAFSKEQRQRPILLSDRQRNLVKTRTLSGYRRIRGAAGTGKSVVVACRAAELARQGSNVLVVCFNITLLKYLRDLAVRHVAASSEIRRPEVFLNFHQWCKRVCLTSAYDSYKQIWKDHPDGGDPQLALERVVELVLQLYRQGSPCLPTYNAILVDEGQDFELGWWEALRQALEPNGEMILVADKTQDIYGTASRWTDATMRGCGFTGTWSELRGSYRLPTPLIPLVQHFANKYLKGEVDPPNPLNGGQRELDLDMDECELRWVHVLREELAAKVCFDEINRMMRVLPQNTAIADLTFLCSLKDLGRDVVKLLQNKGLRVVDTFAQDDREAQRQKRALFQGDARVKATTIHSYKGWEGKLIVVFVESADSPKDNALFYTAMTRLRKDQQQGSPTVVSKSSLTVVSTCGNLRDFGRNWPDYKECP